MKKWLSYREYALLGRPLAPEEARYLSEVARRLAALALALAPQGQGTGVRRGWVLVGSARALRVAGGCYGEATTGAGTFRGLEEH